MGAPPGECYWYRHDLYKIGILLHLSCILPCGLLAIFQFVPKIRHSFILFHRLNGYIVVILTLGSNAGALIIARRAFGGTPVTHSLVGTLFLMSTFGILNAYYNIKRLQLDQHRAWMLRTFAWMGAIVTARIMLLAMVQAISSLPAGYEFYDNRSCDELISIVGPGPVYGTYPECVPGFSNATNANRVIIRADWRSANPFEKVGAAGLAFPATTWLSLALHVIGVELYLALTPREAERLRQVSYERQLARGFKNPGSAGFFLGKYADADPWVPRPGAGETGEAQSSSSIGGRSDSLEKTTARTVAVSA